MSFFFFTWEVEGEVLRLGRPVQAKEDVEVEMDEAEGNGASASQAPPRVWQPGVDEMGEDEELQFDPTAYHCLHSFKLGWPCLRSYEPLNSPFSRFSSGAGGFDEKLVTTDD